MINVVFGSVHVAIASRSEVSGKNCGTLRLCHMLSESSACFLDQPPNRFALAGDGLRGGKSSYLRAFTMRDFANATFPPETITLMEEALEAAVALLPEPVSSKYVHALAEAILRATRDGERDPAVLCRLALLELQISPRL